MDKPFAGSTVIVAGGTGGLGAAVALAFAAAGARVVVTYRRDAELAALRQRAAADTVAIEGHAVDVTDATAVRTMVAATLGRHLRIDALVNTVGGYAGGTPLWQGDGSALERMLAQNVRAGYVLARAVVPPMLAAGRGSIVNIAAKAAVVPAAGAAEYAASKAAALAMMTALAADLAGSGVRVNSVLPSIIDTPANRAAMPAADFAAWPKPASIAQVILFLCSRDADAIHGAAIPVYGHA
ncbi:MAG TPA: SDR family NAD(P)-dependent oxidoreductase [Casimicrobiaceae bacterium]|nr:SDR family NAD(P)-dependent oxidoreductase [Casimicrobiaceae bacterium]